MFLANGLHYHMLWSLAIILSSRLTCHHGTCILSMYTVQFKRHFLMFVFVALYRQFKSNVSHCWRFLNICHMTRGSSCMGKRQQFQDTWYSLDITWNRFVNIWPSFLAQLIWCLSLTGYVLWSCFLSQGSVCKGHVTHRLFAASDF